MPRRQVEMQVSVEARIDALEGASVDVLLDFLRDREPSKTLIEKAKIAQSAFGSVQRRRSAENQRDALSYMMQKEGFGQRMISGSSGGGRMS